jgi:hypothetical protein
MTPKTPAERQAARTARLRAAGLVPRQAWAHPDDWPRVQRYLQRLAKQRGASL